MTSEVIYLQLGAITSTIFIIIIIFIIVLPTLFFPSVITVFFYSLITNKRVLDVFIWLNLLGIVYECTKYVLTMYRRPTW